MGTRFGFVSTYPPTQCGLATFTASLRGALLGSGDEGLVVRLVETPQPSAGTAEVAQLVMGDAASLRASAQHLNSCDVVILQHEFGIYGGPDGADVLTLLDAVDVPRVVVLHTVLTAPSPHQRAVLQAVVARADAVVTMTRTAADRLEAGYDVDMSKVSIIAHGAPDLGQPVAISESRRRRPFTILTWGLLGPGKGLEWGIEALASLTDLDELPCYVIAGQTHPKVLDHEGERYRDLLHEQVHQAGLDDAVVFDPTYRDSASLASLIRAADVVLLPYDSTEQVTSGVLIEAVAAGKPVIATRFPHARELLSGGAGLLVPHRDPAAIAAAIRSLCSSSELADRMARAASLASPSLLWPAVAGDYRTLVAHLLAAKVAA